jgi:hypothetical protein
VGDLTFEDLRQYVYLCHRQKAIDGLTYEAMLTALSRREATGQPVPSLDHPAVHELKPHEDRAQGTESHAAR